jgi:hypothetical protein
MLQRGAQPETPLTGEAPVVSRAAPELADEQSQYRPDAVPSVKQGRSVAGEC